MMASDVSVKNVSVTEALPKEVSVSSFSYTDLSDSRKMGEVGESISIILKGLVTNTKQLGEYLIEQDNVTQSICLALKKILKTLNLSIDLPKEAVAWVGDVKEATLNSQGHLIIVKDMKQVESRSLESYSPKIVLVTVYFALPRLKEAIDKYVADISSRLNLMERINVELTGLLRTIDIPADKKIETSIIPP